MPEYGVVGKAFLDIQMIDCYAMGFLQIFYFVFTAVLRRCGLYLTNETRRQ